MEEVPIDGLPPKRILYLLWSTANDWLSSRYPEECCIMAIIASPDAGVNPLDQFVHTFDDNSERIWYAELSNDYWNR